MNKLSPELPTVPPVPNREHVAGGLRLGVDPVGGRIAGLVRGAASAAVVIDRDAHGRSQRRSAVWKVIRVRKARNIDHVANHCLIRDLAARRLKACSTAKAGLIAACNTVVRILAGVMIAVETRRQDVLSG